MRRDEFILLDLSSKIQFLWDEGDIVSEKIYYDCNITLFLIGNFYVEVFFNRVQNAIISIEVQDNAQILYGYVSDVSLQELENLLS